MGLSVVVFFLSIKKKGATSGFFNSHIYPFAGCFLRNLSSACCYLSAKGYVLDRSALGALGLRSMAWSSLCILEGVVPLDH